MKAIYKMHTQSHRKGAVIDFDQQSIAHKQLLERGIIEILEAPKETKVTGPKETKPATKKATK